ncbi:DUF5590 domain-containing protein [Paenibacillus sp. FJAT-26967]|uniref:cell wall elongation regulator TseB-like domain-containing protein n=1 Tax=Paenibacillus sp. FJAT-26967 TaxID=1729690 RepID=UPI00083893E1|nr:DUF5590 domain-containing protein [Paenibacillus sp. FJAT-26967]
MLRKGIWIGLFVLLTTGFLVNRFYVSVQTDYWQSNTKAVQTALASTSLGQAERVEAFHGSRSYQIIYGKDKQGSSMVVWVPIKEDKSEPAAQEIHVEMTDGAVTEEAIRSALLQKNPKLDIMRVNAGEYKSEYVWEVFYKDENDRHYYDYYNFRTGSYIDTFKLSLQ